MPVPNITVDGLKYPGFSSVFVKYGSGLVYAFIDPEDGSDISTRTTYSIGVAPSKSGISSNSIFPKVQGSKAVYFIKEFKPEQQLGAGTIISIEGKTFLTHSEANDNTWCNYGFNYESVNSGKLVIETN